MRKSLCLFYIPRRRLSINLRNLNNITIEIKTLRSNDLFGLKVKNQIALHANSKAIF